MSDTTGRPTDADNSLGDGKEPAATMPPAFPSHRETLREMIEALRANRGVVDELSKGYTMFRFTGGSVAAQRWDLVALGRYLKLPFAVDRIVTAEAERYRQLAVDIMALGQTIAESGPKPLRRRFAIVDGFREMSAEIGGLAAKLEIAMAGLLEAPTRPSGPSENVAASALVGLKVAPPCEVKFLQGGGR